MSRALLYAFQHQVKMFYGIETGERQAKVWPKETIVIHSDHC